MSAFAGLHRIDQHIVTTFGDIAAGITLFTAPANTRVEIDKLIMRHVTAGGGTGKTWALRLNGSALFPLWAGVQLAGEDRVWDLTPQGKGDTSGSFLSLVGPTDDVNFSLKGMILAPSDTLQIITVAGSSSSTGGSMILSGRILEQK